MPGHSLRPIAVMFLDLDDFKRVNDTLGHPAGDRVLREFAMLVSGGARATDLATRYGGEEFAIVLPHTDRDHAQRVAERIRAAVADFSFLEPDHPLRVTVSAGAATFAPGLGIASSEQLVAAADRALYAAKKAGKNRVVVDHDTMKTSVRGVFAGGDNVNGADLVVTALAHGHAAADAIHAYLGGAAW